MTEKEEKRQHYSQARGRFFRDGDWLSIGEVCAVLAENRGEPIRRESARVLVLRWHVHQIDGPLYLYDDIRDKVVKRQRGRRRLPDNELSPSALRQREFKERQRAKKAMELRESQAEYKPD